MKANQASAAEMKLVGGRLCLDFINTVDGRKSDSPRRESHSFNSQLLGDKLGEYSDLVEWSRHAGIVTATVAEIQVETGAVSGATCRIAAIWQRFVDTAHVYIAVIRLRDD